MTVEYRDESEFSNELHSVSQIADALRHKKFGKDVREAIAQAVEKLYGIGPSTVISGSPAGAYATLAELQSAYPNGQQGVFVVAETGKWYLWDPRKEVWIEGGDFQTPMSQSEIEDGRIWGDGTKSNSIGTAIRGQILKEKNERIQNIEQEKTERIKSDEKLQGQINLYSTALEFKEVRLKDNANNLLWDGNNYVTGNVYLPKTDKTGFEEGVPVDSSIIGYTFLGHLEEYGLPILKLESPDLLNLTSKAQGKLKGVKFDYNPNGFEGHLSHKTGVLKSIKVQGASSQGYPKKNYTLNFEDDVQLKSTWGNHDKYVIKADWVDFSHMRNEFGANLWKRIRETKIKNSDNLIDENGNFLIDKNNNILSGETNPAFLGPAMGAIDSFPILVFINEKYHGVYSFTIPKTDWMAGMGSGKKEAILSAETHSSATQFRNHVIDKNGILDDKDFSVEYASDENWIVDSLNSMIDSVGKDSMDEFIDLDSAIDYLLFNTLLGNGDGIDKNFLLNTWNGKKWFFNAYDMDSSFGNFWDGTKIIPTDAYMFDIHRNKSKLWEYLIDNKKDKLKERWFFLRKNILKKDNLISDVYNHASSTPDAVFDYEKRRWPNRPNTRTNTPSQIAEWLEKRLDKIDNYLQ